MLHRAVGPAQHVNAHVHAAQRRLRHRARPDEHVAHMAVAQLGQRGHNMAASSQGAVVHEREALGGEVEHRGCVVEPALEPGLDGVVVGRNHLSKQPRPHGPHMLGDDLGMHRVIGVRALHRQHDKQGEGQAEDEAQARSSPADVAPGPASRCRCVVGCRAAGLHGTLPHR